MRILIREWINENETSIRFRLQHVSNANGKQNNTLNYLFEILTLNLQITKLVKLKLTKLKAYRSNTPTLQT